MHDPLFVEKNKNIDYAIKYIIKNSLDRVPVVNSAIGMEFVGIVTATDLLKAKKLTQ